MGANISGKGLVWYEGYHINWIMRYTRCMEICFWELSLLRCITVVLVFQRPAIYFCQIFPYSLNASYLEHQASLCYLKSYIYLFIWTCRFTVDLRISLRNEWKNWERKIRQNIKIASTSLKNPRKYRKNIFHSSNTSFFTWFVEHGTMNQQNAHRFATYFYI